MAKDYSQTPVSELRATFDRHVVAIEAGGISAKEVYLRCNTIRNVLKEYQRRGLAEPRFPETPKADASRMWELFDETMDAADQVLKSIFPPPKRSPKPKK